MDFIPLMPAANQLCFDQQVSAINRIVNRIEAKEIAVKVSNTRIDALEKHLLSESLCTRKKRKR